MSLEARGKDNIDRKNVPVNIADFENIARKQLSEVAFDFFAGGAEEERTLRDNVDAYQRHTLLPRVLRSVGPRQLQTTLLGQTMSMPLCVAPTAFHRLAHADGECAVARAAARAGVPVILSMAATTSLETVVSSCSEGTYWFQMYVHPERDCTERFVKRAADVGCKAIVVTVDSPVFGRRERDLRRGFDTLPNGLSLQNFRSGKEPCTLEFKEDICWSDIEWMRSQSDIPIVLKGILHPEDARLAKECGVEAIVVSNHGGRQLDTVPATIDVLPEIAAAAGDMPVLIDGGIRRGTDIIKALSLGACATAVGRPILWGLAANGEEGVLSVLTLLREELNSAMALMGCTSTSELVSDLVRRSC